MAQDSQHLIWIDLEMTGLNPDSDLIIEIATVVTDKDLNILAQGPVLAVHQSDAALAAMDDWNQKHHGGSGLIDRVKASTINDAEARKQNFGQVSNAFIRVCNGETGAELIRYDLGEDFSVETAVVVAELYRNGTEWKFNAIGSGFHGGLEALCKNFGVSV